MNYKGADQTAQMRSCSQNPKDRFSRIDPQILGFFPNICLTIYLLVLSVVNVCKQFRPDKMWGLTKCVFMYLNGLAFQGIGRCTFFL